MKRAAEVLTLSGALTGVGLAGIYAVSRMCFYNEKRYRNAHTALPKGEPYASGREQCLKLIREMMAIPCEEVEIRSRRGERLTGRYYHTAVGAPLDICFHGYKGTAIRDFCGGAQLLLSLGHNVLLVDERGQGRSEGKWMTFGILERYDLLDWVRYGLERFGSETRIFLYGISMGAATVVMASGLDLPPQVKGIVADCPYSSPRDIIESVVRQMGYPAKPVYAMLTAGASIFGGFDLNEITAEEAVRHTKVPVLVIHGEADRLVPCEMSRCIKEANPDMVRRETFPGAQHGFSFMVDRPRYERIVTEFLSGLL